MIAKLGAMAVAAILLAGCQEGGDRFKAPSTRPTVVPDELSSADSWRLPPGGVVRDRRAAVSIARAVWFSTTGIDPSRSSDEVWQNGTTAKLEGGVWVIKTKRGQGTIGGGVQVLVSKVDGRILGIYAWQ
ncbi:hypothetical protein KXS07_13515 [Inquilinus limosus]|uniref:hypothetical protein n=1 Tax=Inquilinus limosus TaxID=171674 RepID=UPI003F17E4F1